MQREELLAFGQAVRERRRQLAISQEHLAELADLHRTYISGVEGGRRNVGLVNVYRLAVALRMSTPELFAAAEGLRRRRGSVRRR